MYESTFTVSGMVCRNCEVMVSSAIERIEGVTAVTALPASGLVVVASERPVDPERVRAAVADAGYELAADPG